MSKKEFVQSILSPLVAVITSPATEELIKTHHNIPTFIDFIRPFGSSIEGKGILFVRNIMFVFI